MHKSSSSPEDEEWPLQDSSRAIIALFPNVRKAHEAGLAVLAAGSAYWVYPYEGRYALVVRSSESSRLKHEIQIYRDRNRFWPKVSASLPEKNILAYPTYLFVAMLISVFLLQGNYPNLDDLGMNSSRDFWDENAWWRIVTAITLHADLGHLAGNLFGMGLFGYFAARYLGNGLAWISILLAAALANLTNNLIHFDSIFNSLGASTAVFGALGLVTGFPVGSYLRTGNPITSRQWVIPLAGGLMLLAWLGSGNFPTDVAGHLWAFLYGLIVAGIIGRFRLHAKVTKTGQAGMLIGTWLLIVLCWAAALSAG